MAKIFATATVWPKGIGKEPATAITKCAHMTPDLPADYLGELVADAMQEALKAGYDPCADAYAMTLTFDQHTD